MGEAQARLPDLDAAGDATVLRLPDGRDLAYTGWGDPSGFPAFYFHGTPSSRLEGALAHMAGLRHGFRLIAIDRPGYGRSTFQPRRTFRDWPRDVSALADHLGLDVFGVVGHSGAGPHLFACGAFLPAERLKFVGAIGPWGPVASPQIMASLNRLDRFYATLSREAPWIMQATFAPLAWCARHWPSMFFRLMEGAVSEADKRWMQDPLFLGHMRRMELEAFRQGGRGGAYEAFIAFRDWGFDIADVRTPTYIWLGDRDIFVPRAMGEYIARTIPGVQLRWAPGAGHFNIENWDDVLAACRRHVS